MLKAGRITTTIRRNKAATRGCIGRFLTDCQNTGLRTLTLRSKHFDFRTRLCRQRISANRERKTPKTDSVIELRPAAVSDVPDFRKIFAPRGSAKLEAAIAPGALCVFAEGKLTAFCIDNAQNGIELRTNATRHHLDGNRFSFPRPEAVIIQRQLTSSRVDCNRLLDGMR